MGVKKRKKDTTKKELTKKEVTKKEVTTKIGSPKIISTHKQEELFTTHNEDIIGEINFVTSANSEYSKYAIVSQQTHVGEFTQKFFSEYSKLPTPKVLISVTGNAADFKLLKSFSEQVFSRGLLCAAKYSAAWIVTGGLECGVMKHVGNAICEEDIQIPCIGIATYNMVTHKEKFSDGGVVDYTKERKNSAESAALEPNHSHFVLVQSDNDNWGEEISFRAELEDHIRTQWHVPVVLVAVNGGPGTLQTILEGARKGFKIIIVDGSGRVADAISAYIKHQKDCKYSLRLWDTFLNSAKPEQREKFTQAAQELYSFKKNIYLYNPNDEECNLDVPIYRSILSFEDQTLAQNLSLCVEWNRTDMMEEILANDIMYINSAENDVSYSEERIQSINDALEEALLLNKPKIYELLLSKGAEVKKVNQDRLYALPDIQYQVKRLIPFARLRKSERLAKKLARNEPFDPKIVKGILQAISVKYANLLTGDSRELDVLLWAILVDRNKLAKVIWRYSKYPIHFALIASRLYATLSEWFHSEASYLNHHIWFENAAINVLSELTYEDAKVVLEHKWNKLTCNALEMADIAECKTFFAQPYLQRYLDEKLYSDEMGGVPPGISFSSLILMVLFPFYIMSSGHYTSFGSSSRFYHFYNIPAVKFVSSTICYIMFLILLTINIIGSDPVGFEIKYYEWVLWAWLFSSTVEEISQYTKEPKEYFHLLSNQMDTFMYFGLIISVVLRNFAVAYKSEGFQEAYMDVLVISTIVCFMRLMNVFAFSKSLGPLFFVIMRLFNDVWQWLFIFFIFMISFQIGFFALTKQAKQDPLLPYPRGTLGIGFSTLIGDTGEHTMAWMQDTHIGVILLSIYAIIVQVMLVNLLIAMMGSTYSLVQDNSDKEWKFYRYGLTIDYLTCSPFPPPFNIIGLLMDTSSLESTAPFDEAKTTNKMRIASTKVAEQEEKEELNSQGKISSMIRENMRLSTAQRESDRLYLEYHINYIESSHETLVKANAELQKQLTMTNATLLAMQAKIDKLTGEGDLEKNE